MTTTEDEDGGTPTVPQVPKPRRQAPGVFITFEGGEGAGKSTQIQALAHELRECGEEAIVTREPGGSEGAELIRKLIVTGATDKWSGLTEALLISAARADHIEKIIRPALARGAWVLCDRFTDSTMAYQGYARDLGPEMIDKLNDIACDNVVPDMTFILDLPVEEGLARAASRDNAGEERFENMEGAFHQRLRAAFRDIAARDEERCHLIHAAQSKEDVTKDIIDRVKARFGIERREGAGRV